MHFSIGFTAFSGWHYAHCVVKNTKKWKTKQVYFLTIFGPVVPRSACNILHPVAENMHFSIGFTAFFVLALFSLRGQKHKNMENKTVDCFDQKMAAVYPVLLVTATSRRRKHDNFLICRQQNNAFSIGFIVFFALRALKHIEHELYKESVIGRSEWELARQTRFYERNYIRKVSLVALRGNWPARGIFMKGII